MIGAAVEQSLKDATYAVDWVRDGQTALATVASQDYGLMLLDLGLPKKDGVEVLRALRARGSALPVVIITARDALQDRVQGLDCGADDYVVKPFEMAELLARMRAVVRRKGGTAGPLLGNASLSLDPVSRAASVQGTTVQLSAREFSVLQALMVRPGAILSRAELEDRVYGWNEEVESNAVEVYIHSLRRKLGPDWIRNLRGVGYFVPRQA